MGPKKKEKSKEAEWLECSLCKKWITPPDAEQHSKSCDSDHPVILNYCLTGRVIKAEDLKDEEGCQVTKSVRNKDTVVWLSIPTMAICGLSIGQNIVVNGKSVKRAWPLKGMPLSHIGMSKDARNEMNIEEGSLVTVTKFEWNGDVVHSMVLQLLESNSIFEKDGFGDFLSSHLDGTFITSGSKLSIKYFGQVCHCIVKDIELTKKGTASCSSDLISANLSELLNNRQSKDGCTDSHTSLQESSSDTQSCKGTPTQSCKGTPKRDLTDTLHDSNLSGSSDVSRLTESFTEMDISNLSSTDTTLQETPVKLKYPNLVTPLKPEGDQISLKPFSCNIFGKIISGFSKISVKPSVTSVEDKPVEHKFSLNDIGGMSLQIEVLMKRISHALKPSSFSKCILVQGPPGTGKSVIVRAVTTHLQMHTFYVSGTDIWSKLFGEAEANLQKIFVSAQERSPAVIIFDDLHVICSKRSSNYAGQQEHRIVGTLLSLIDGISSSKDYPIPKVVIIGITNNVDAIDPALRRAGRFGCEIEIGVPNSSQRSEILSVILNRMSHSLTPVEIRTVAYNAHGYVGADIAALVNEAFIHAINQQDTTLSSSDIGTVTITLDDLVHAGHLIKPSALREIQLEVPQVRWTDIGGMEEVKMRLKEAVEIPLTHPELYHNLGIEPPKGLLMYGPPGCSKTMIAKAVATECHLNFLAVKGPELFNQYVGESEKNIRQIFSKAKSAAPSVIFFDEIDAIAATRGSSTGGSSGVDDRVLTQLLTEMDGLEHLKDVFIMAATNRPDKIDRALLRPGRFDSLIYVPLPNDKTRREILQNKLKKMGVCQDVNIENLVEKTLDYSGAEIIQMCQEAAFCALREDINTRKVEQKHFDIALTKVIPQIDVELLKIYEKFSSGR